MKKEHNLSEYIPLGLLVIVCLILLLIFGCNSSKMIQSPYGKVYKFQIEEIERVRGESNVD